MTHPLIDRSSMIQVGTSVVILALGVIIGELLSRLGVVGTVITSLVGLTLIFGNLLFVSLASRSKVEEAHQRLVTELSGVVETLRKENARLGECVENLQADTERLRRVSHVAAHDHRWPLCETSQLASLEPNFGAREIIVASKSLDHHRMGGAFALQLDLTLLRGATYTVLVPARPEMILMAQEIATAFHHYGNQFTVATDQSILDAMALPNVVAYVFADQPPRVYAQLPVHGDPDHRPWFRIDDIETAYVLTSRLQRMKQDGRRITSTSSVIQ